MTLVEGIEKLKKNHYRTVHDTGASWQSLRILNLLESYADLPTRTNWGDLAAFCSDCEKYHVNPCNWRQSKYDSPEFVEYMRHRQEAVLRRLTS